MGITLGQKSEKEDGEIIRDENLIEEEIVNYYKNLYEDFEDIVSDNDDNFFNHISGIDRQKGDDVTRLLEEAELRKTLETCSDSAPGPDGIPYSYIKVLWSIFGTLMVEACIVQSDAS